MDNVQNCDSYVFYTMSTWIEVDASGLRHGPLTDIIQISKRCSVHSDRSSVSYTGKFLAVGSTGFSSDKIDGLEGSAVQVRGHKLWGREFCKDGCGGEKKSLFKEMVVTDGQTYAGGQGQDGESWVDTKTMDATLNTVCSALSGRRVITLGNN
jgi:hypothetical protein